MEFEKCLRDGRRKIRISQRDLAERVGLSTESIVKLESGQFAEVSENQLLKIAQIINLDGHIFTQMYRAMFRSELKAAPHPPVPMVEIENNGPTPLIEPDLIEIANCIKALPTEVKNNLLEIVKVLANTQLKEGAA